MARQIKRITGIEGIAAGATGSVKLPVNCRYFGLMFQTRINGVLTLASNVVERLRIYVNGSPVWDVPVEYLLANYVQDGRTVTAGYLPVVFADPARADKIDEAVFAWDMFGEASLEVEFVMKAQAPGDVPSISGVREYDFGEMTAKDPLTGKVSRLKQIVKLTTLRKACVGGLNDIDNIKIRDAIQRICFFGAVLPTEYKIDADGDTKIEATDAELVEIMKAHGFFAAPGCTAVRFDYTERADDFLAVKRDLNVRLTMPAPGDLDLLIQTIAPGFI